MFAIPAVTPSEMLEDLEDDLDTLAGACHFADLELPWPAGDPDISPRLRAQALSDHSSCLIDALVDALHVYPQHLKAALGAYLRITCAARQRQ